MAELRIEFPSRLGAGLERAELVCARLKRIYPILQSLNTFINKHNWHPELITISASGGEDA